MTVSAPVVLGTLAVVFLAAALLRFATGDSASARIQSRIWLLVAVIFGVVSVVLRMSGA